MRRLKDIVCDALELAPAQRASFLATACAGDDALLSDARALVAADAGSADDFLAPPGGAAGLAATSRNEPTTGEERPELPIAAVLGDRYRLERILGRGAFGVVYGATDLLTRRAVAAKVLSRLPTASRAIVRREIATLRLLRVPGVVRLIDDGLHDDLPYLVTELVAGKPFPSAGPTPWSDLAETATSFVEGIARLHAHGVIHGDLKPANVLVDERRRPMILDLGLSTGPSVIDPKRAPLGGTPMFLAPEQMRGDPASFRSDLYAAGLMLYRALAGRAPHAGDATEQLTRRRERTPPQPLDGTVPAAVGALIASLLAPEASDRPPSAAHAAAILRGQLPPSEYLENLPLVGRHELLETIVDGARSGRSLAVWGRDGHGKTRLLGAAGERLGELGVATVAVGSAMSLGELRLALEGVGVVLIDDADRMRPELTRELASLRGRAVVQMRSAPTPEARPIPPLSAADLAPLFAGPERIFHLQSDPARELERRTRGVPAAVVRELGTWQRAGLTELERGRIKLDRASLGLLRAGVPLALPHTLVEADAGPTAVDPELVLLLERMAPAAAVAVLCRTTGRDADAVQTTLDRMLRAGVVEQTADGRYHATAETAATLGWSIISDGADGGDGGDDDGEREDLTYALSSEDSEPAARRAAAMAIELSGEGRVSEARAVVRDGLGAVRRTGVRGGIEVELLKALLRVAIADGTEEAIELTLHELGRADRPAAEHLRLEQLTKVALLALRRDGDRALALADTLGELTEPALELIRQSARIMAARCGQTNREEKVIGEVAAWAERTGDDDARRLVAEARGWRCYSVEDFAAAAAEQRRAVDLAGNDRARLSSLLNVASAELECFAYDGLRTTAAEAKRLATACRHGHYEAWAEWLERSAAYRGGACLEPDLELVEAVTAVGVPNLEASILLNEAAVAWRGDDRALARELALAAARSWQQIGHVHAHPLARAFAIGLGEPAADGEIDELMKHAAEKTFPVLGIQILASLAMSPAASNDDLGEPARALGAKIASEQHSHRREIWSVAEALEQIERTTLTRSRVSSRQAVAP